MQKLLNIDANAKTVKGQKQGYMTAILYLAPSDLSGFQVCPTASPGCRAACLNTAGRGAFNATQAARIRKTLSYFSDRPAFMAQLHKEIGAFVKRAGRKGLTPCVRLNGTSDIPFERVPVVVDWQGEQWTHRNIMAAYPALQFYDYTKRANRRDLPANYHLTFSHAEDNARQAFEVLNRGDNVAVVYRRDLPSRDRVGTTFAQSCHAPVIDGSETDLRFLDPKGVIVGLCAKGKARYDETGFVRN
jgi:hypothetical protein